MKHADNIIIALLLIVIALQAYGLFVKTNQEDYKECKKKSDCKGQDNLCIGYVAGKGSDEKMGTCQK